MRKLLTIAAVAAFTASLAVAQYKIDPTRKSGHVQLPQSQNSGPLQITTSTQTEMKVGTAPRISREEAQKLVKAGKAIYVDVRSTATYNLGHLPGAISIPGSQLLHRLNELPPGKKLITYCACVEEHTAAIAVVNLASHNVKNAAALRGGWNEWKAARLPIEVTGVAPVTAARR
jgi:rhodanese-related sulfurtransferase